MLDLIAFLAGTITDFNLEGRQSHGVLTQAKTRLLFRARPKTALWFRGFGATPRQKAIVPIPLFMETREGVEFSDYDNAAPIRIETLADGDAVAHEGVMGGVRKEAELVQEELCPPVESYPGNGQIQDIVDVLRGVPGAECTSTLDNAMNTLRITWAAHELRAKQRGEASETA